MWTFNKLHCGHDTNLQPHCRTPLARPCRHRVLHRRQGLSTGLASSESSSKTATLTRSCRATQTRTVRKATHRHRVELCVATETRRLDQLFKQESSTESEQESTTDSHSAQSKAQAAQQSTAVGDSGCCASNYRLPSSTGTTAHQRTDLISGEVARRRERSRPHLPLPLRMATRGSPSRLRRWPRGLANCTRTPLC